MFLITQLLKQNRSFYQTFFTTHVSYSPEIFHSQALPFTTPIFSPPRIPTAISFFCNSSKKINPPKSITGWENLSHDKRIEMTIGFGDYRAFNQEEILYYAIGWLSAHNPLEGKSRALAAIKTGLDLKGSKQSRVLLIQLEKLISENKSVDTIRQTLKLVDNPSPKKLFHKSNL